MSTTHCIGLETFSVFTTDVTYESRDTLSLRSSLEIRPEASVFQSFLRVLQIRFDQLLLVPPTITQQDRYGLWWQSENGANLLDLEMLLIIDVRRVKYFELNLEWFPLMYKNIFIV